MYENKLLKKRRNKQKIGLNNLDLKRINITTKKPITESNNNINEKPKEKEQIKHIPKILTFLQTFKNISLPLKIDKKKKKEFKNKLEEEKPEKEEEVNNEEEEIDEQEREEREEREDREDREEGEDREDREEVEEREEVEHEQEEDED